MMTIKRRRIEITAFEQERIIRRASVYRCPVCELESEMLTFEQAGALIRADVRSVYRCLTDGSAHALRTPDGQYRVCKNSLSL